MNIIAGDRPDRFGRVANIGASDLVTLGRDSGVAPLDITSEEAHQIEQMNSQHQHIFATGAAILFSIRMNFHQVTDQALLKP